MNTTETKVVFDRSYCCDSFIDLTEDITKSLYGDVWKSIPGSSGGLWPGQVIVTMTWTPEEPVEDETEEYTIKPKT
jgi:hypothetical protein